MKKKIILVLIIAICACFFAGAPFALAAKLGEGVAAPATKEPIPDYYFFLILLFFALIVFQAVRLVLLIIKYKKVSGTKVSAIIPYKLATLLPLAAVEWILVGEIFVFAILYFISRNLQRKIKKSE